MFFLKFGQVVSVVVDNHPVQDKVRMPPNVERKSYANQRSSFVLWLATSSLEKIFDIVRVE